MRIFYGLWSLWMLIYSLRVLHVWHTLVYEWQITSHIQVLWLEWSISEKWLDLKRNYSVRAHASPRYSPWKKSRINAGYNDLKMIRQRSALALQVRYGNFTAKIYNDDVSCMVHIRSEKFTRYRNKGMPQKRPVRQQTNFKSIFEYSDTHFMYIRLYQTWAS